MSEPVSIYAMEEAQLRFGSLASADVILWLTSPRKKNHERNLVYVHSVILQTSEFFEVKMPEPCSSGKPTEIRVITSHNFDDYLKCIELMYGERVYFFNVEECLAIPSIASELLVDECMQYLEAVRWSADQESQIRDVLPSLGLKSLPDLAARLDKEDDDHMIFVEGIINQMVSLIQGHHQVTRSREIAKQYIMGILEGNSCREVVEVCGRVLLREFKSSISSRNFSAIRSLSKFIEHCEGEILEAAFIAFAGDPEFMKHVKELAWDTYRQCSEDAFCTMIWFMKATGDRKI